MRGGDIRNQHIFNSKVDNNHACNPNMPFDASNDRKYQKVIQNGLQRETQNPSKIIENHTCNPNMFFDASNDRKYQKVIQTGLQRVPKIDQKSPKIHPGNFQGPSVCIRDPLDCKMIPNWCPRTSKWSQNGHPRTLKVNENQQTPTTNYVTKRLYFD